MVFDFLRFRAWIIEVYLGRKVKLIVHEDNEACIKVVNKGYSPALRHLERTARCSIGFPHELFVENKETAETCLLQYCPTLLQKADLFTKALERVAYQRNLALIKVSGLRRFNSSETVRTVKKVFWLFPSASWS